jgi:hypothetical protein
MDGFLVDHQFYAVICDVDDRAFAKQVCLTPVWLFIWCSPWLCFLLKVRVTEIDKGLVNTLQLGGLPVCRWSRPVVPGIWSVDRMNGRYRLNRIGTDGLTVHYPWRLHYQPLFLTPDNQISDINGGKHE